jgi:hypothetical protein
MGAKRVGGEDLDGGAFLQCLHDGVDGHGARRSSSADSVSLGRLRQVVQYRKGLVPATNEHETQILHQDRGSSNARSGSSLRDDLGQRGHQERRARANANGEELEREQSLDWRTQGWTMNDDL